MILQLTVSVAHFRGSVCVAVVVFTVQIIFAASFLNVIWISGLPVSSEFLVIFWVLFVSLSMLFPDTFPNAWLRHIFIIPFSPLDAYRVHLWRSTLAFGSNRQSRQLPSVSLYLHPSGNNQDASRSLSIHPQFRLDVCKKEAEAYRLDFQLSTVASLPHISKLFSL